ncbi:MAG: hypothetical protein JWO96_623 [Candidatus Saccharibacteria bacterium]|nr:hypothetical protein [Candidatus Saccharibacteria bacterium]
MSDFKFYLSKDSDKAAEYIAARVGEQASKGSKVLFLLPGGSAADLAVKAAMLLIDSKANVCFTLTDERYGPPGHPDSNWAALLQAGLKLEGAQYYEVLRGLSFDATTQAFDEFLAKSVDEFDFITGVFGMGADGHTAGILPGSPAVQSPDYAANYTAADYPRITTTPKFLSKLDAAFLYASGQNKHQMLDTLEQDTDVDVQPAQILKRAHSLTVFNDYKGEEL